MANLTRECLQPVQFAPPISSAFPSEKLSPMTGYDVFNGEAKIADLFRKKVTPTDLHYVRSHGPVPDLKADHKLSITATPDGETKKYTVDDVKKLTQFTIPVTLACDGNRRKEVNMMKRTDGFNWSPTAVSTSEWTGTLLCSLLINGGLKPDPDGEWEQWHINFRGADAPQSGAYETSIPLVHVMNPSNDVMIAVKQNGQDLTPYHGYPMRVIIPGYVGGRQVKWLSDIWVSKKPNESHYHEFDNRVMPSFIKSMFDDSDIAKELRKSEDTACMEQTLQSVICKPEHGERIDLSRNGAKYTVAGFAYNGGGSRIKRVEITLDGGKTWKLCIKNPIETSPRHGDKYWCWVFWECVLSVVELLNVKEVAVRAWDSKMLTQPENIPWCCTGMMNNSWYRIRSYGIEDPNNKIIEFKHPVASFIDPSGWMVSNPVDVDPPVQPTRQCNEEEIKEHDRTHVDPWVVMNDIVYTVATMVPEHPGGKDAILRFAGQVPKPNILGAGEFFANIHGDYAHEKRRTLLVGRYVKKHE